MSYEDLEEARAKRTTKNVTAGKGKRRAKRKSPTPEMATEAQVGSPKVVTDPSVPKDKVARVSEIKPVKTL